MVNFIRNVVAGDPLEVLVHGDSYALPSKILHGPITNARPLLNFTTMWMLNGAHAADQCVPVLAQRGVSPCTQFTVHASSSVADFLSVLHNFTWYLRFF